MRYRIHGLDCAEEVAALRAEVGPAVGGEQLLSFDILQGTMTVDRAAGEVPAELIVAAVARTGLRAEPWCEAGPAAAGAALRQQRGRTAATAISGLMALAGLGLHAYAAGSLAAALGVSATAAAPAPPAAVACYLAAIVAGAWFVLPKAWHAARRLRPDMNLLMVLAVAGAAAIGDWLEAASVSFLFALSLLLEAWSVGRARRAVAELLDLAPPRARLKAADGHEFEAPPQEVPVGSLVVVKPGERVPLDGVVESGESEVNQAPITGESLSVAKAAGDPVFAGTINGHGALEFRTTRPAGETTLAHIVQLIHESQSRRGPAEQCVDGFARVYTPAVMAAALAVLAIPPLAFGQPWLAWLYRALVLLVIACPCALVISTPVSVVAALTAAARRGVLVKGGRALEAVGRLQAMAFDKTGTLTEGRPSVVQIVPLSEHTEQELLERAASLEARSPHPLGQAIVAAAHQRGVPVRPAADFRMLPGQGATGTFGESKYWLGSHRFLRERNQETGEVQQRLQLLSGEGRTVVAVGNDRHVCGLIALADRLRPGAREAIRELQGVGVRHVVLLTGDNRETAEAIAAAAGIAEYRAELLPEEKAAEMERLAALHGGAGMVGDGVNDAPALACATVGIAMGAAGSDAAIDTADAALMSGELALIPWLVRHSRRTLGVIRQNIAFALFVKFLFAMLTMTGHASMWAAIAADTGTSLLVILNALRLLRPNEARAKG